MASFFVSRILRQTLRECQLLCNFIFVDYDQPANTKEAMGNIVSCTSGSTASPDSDVKCNSYNILVENDLPFCWICDMAITKNKMRILVDFNNNKVKLFSPDMEFLSSVSVPARPFNIAVVNDKTAIVTTKDSSPLIMGISEGQLSIKRTMQLDYEVRGISSYKDKLVVTCLFTRPPSVKLIDQTGKVYWSASTDQQGRPLFGIPEYVHCHDDVGAATVVVTDRDKNALVLLKAETGEVVTTRQLKGNERPCAATTDAEGNIYACYNMSKEVSVLTADLTEERILLKKRDFQGRRPEVAVYDDIRKELIVSYGVILPNHTTSIDGFQFP